MKDMGKVMKGAKEKCGAAADGKTINEVVRELLSQEIIGTVLKFFCDFQKRIKDKNMEIIKDKNILKYVGVRFYPDP